jgi:tetratricopeptide (TPR) repeat protein
MSGVLIIKGFNESATWPLINCGNQVTLHPKRRTFSALDFTEMHKLIKPFLAALMILGGVALIVFDYIGWGIFSILMAALPILLFFINEYVLLALWRLRKQDLAGAEKWLNKITSPDRQIIKKQQGYYYYLCGILEGQRNIGKSEQLMKKALSLGLRFDHDKAIATLNLAAAALAKGRKQEAERLLAEAKKYDKAGMVEDQIKMMKQQMKKVNIPGGYFNPNMRRR